jgi:hypothetical protein
MNDSVNSNKRINDMKKLEINDCEIFELNIDVPCLGVVKTYISINVETLAGFPIEPVLEIRYHSENTIKAIKECDIQTKKRKGL